MPNRSIIPVSRLWWGILLIMLLLAGALYYTGYTISLPYVDHPDEPSFNLAAQMIIDSGTAKPMGYNAYPPGIISLNYLVLKTLNQTVRHPASDFIAVVRLITVTASLFSVVVVALLAYELAGLVAGVFAAFIWAVNPIWNAHFRFATADPFVTVFALLALWLVCVGTTHRRQALITASSYTLMLAIAFKTQAIFLLPVIYGLPLLRWWDTPEPAARREIIRAALWNALRWGLFLFWLLALYPTLDANKIIQWVAPTDKIALPSPQLLLAHLDISVLATRSLLAWLAVALILVFTWRDKHAYNHLSLIAVLVAWVGFLFGISLFGLQDIRQMYFLVAMGDLLTGVALALAAKSLLPRIPLPSAIKLAPSTVAYGLVSLYILIALQPAVAASIAAAQDAVKPDRRNNLATNMDTSLAPAPYITTMDNHKTLNRDYGGYHGINDFPLVTIANLLDKPLDEWRAQKVTYAIVPYGDAKKLPDPNQVLLLKSYPPDDHYRGPSMQVVRLQPIQTRLANPLALGTINLIGYDLSAPQVSAGSDVTLTYYWQASAPTAVPMRVFTHLYPLDRTEVVAQQDGLPLVDDLERRPTTLWDDPDEVLVSRSFTVSLPPDLAPARYRIALGFYDPVSGQRLATASGETYLAVTEIEVTAPTGG